jgi:hypothetical protein
VSAYDGIFTSYFNSNKMNYDERLITALPGWPKQRKQQKNSERLAVFWLTEASMAQRFRRERGAAR